MIRDAIRRRNGIDWLIMLVCAIFSTLALYEDRVPGPLDPRLFLVLPVWFVTTFLLSWIIIAFIDGR